MWLESDELINCAEKDFCLCQDLSLVSLRLKLPELRMITGCLLSI